MAEPGQCFPGLESGDGSPSGLDSGHGGVSGPDSGDGSPLGLESGQEAFRGRIRSVKKLSRAGFFRPDSFDRDFGSFVHDFFGKRSIFSEVSRN